MAADVRFWPTVTFLDTDYCAAKKTRVPKAFPLAFTVTLPFELASM